MSGILDGKVALVIGVSKAGQVGQAVAQALAEVGAALAIAARTQANVMSRAEELRASGATVLPLTADLTDEGQVGMMIERVSREYGKLDILVNLAGGLTCQKPVTEWGI